MKQKHRKYRHEKDKQTHRVQDIMQHHWEITAQCDAWFSALYKYSYLLTYLLREGSSNKCNSSSNNTKCAL